MQQELIDQQLGLRFDREEIMEANISRARHGGCYDRGSADSYYCRAKQPHYYVGSSLLSERVGLEEMSEFQIMEYNHGYNDNEKQGNHKEWDWLIHLKSGF